MTVCIYENALGGRNTGYNDDVEPGRNGRYGFRYVLEMNALLDLVIIMLGTNDCKCRFSQHPAWDSALNVQQLVRELLQIMFNCSEEDLRMEAEKLTREHSLCCSQAYRFALQYLRLFELQIES